MITSFLMIWAFLGVMMTFLWILYSFSDKASFVDVGWGLGFVGASFLFAAGSVTTGERHYLILLMVSLWGLRLSAHILRRLMSSKKDDPRYNELRSWWKTRIPFKFFLFFQAQALAIAVLSLPFYLALVNPDPRIGIWEIIGTGFWLIGLCGESLADTQLNNFKRLNRHSGRTCRSGLWKYSRHPNYFFEWLIWIGFFLFALGSPHGWASVYVPIIMYILLNHMTGIPLTERLSIRHRGEDYRDYQRSTSRFFPWPPGERS